tara:strand:- start:9381 stop:10403 length:1023 start_codon:yes stop_codon:yes gene_type:complete
MEKTPKANKVSELAMVIKGEVISSNFADFRLMAIAQIDGLNMDPTTDEDFNQAGKDAVALKGFEAKLTTAKKDFLAQLDDVNTLLESMDDLSKLASKARLDLEKKVKVKKELIRADLLLQGYAALERDLPSFRAQILDAIKGKKALLKMQEAITEVVENANARVQANLKTVATAVELHGEAVKYDIDLLIAKDPESVRIEMERRGERVQAALDKKALEDKLKASEAIKAQAEKELRESEAKTRAKAIRLAGTESHEPAPKAEEPVIEHSAPKEPEESESYTGEDLAAEDEILDFIESTMQAFAPVKAARKALKHQSNIDAVKSFATGLGIEWNKFKAAIK